MPEADFDSDGFRGYNRPGRDAGRIYLKANLAEQYDRRRLLDMFNRSVVARIISLHLILDSIKYPDSITGEIQQLKEAVDSAIENSHNLANEIAPHVVFSMGLRAALYELCRRHAEEKGMRYFINIPDAVLVFLDEPTSIILHSLIKKIVAGAVYSCCTDMLGISLQTSDTRVEIVIQVDGSFSGDFEQLLNGGQYPEQAFLLEAAEQVYLLGGRFWMDKAAGMRTICAEIPLKTAENT